MKVMKVLPAYLLAVLFLVFGFNFFFHFISMPAASGDAGTFIGLLYSTGFLKLVKVLEIVFGFLLLFKVTRALGQVLIAPICVNILLYELFMAHQPGLGVLLVVLDALAIYFSKEKYMGIVKENADTLTV
jgi:hypothetical protein